MVEVPAPAAASAPARKGLFTLDPLSRRRWASFKANRRGLWSFRIFLVLFALALAAPLVANDKPLWVVYRGDVLFPIWQFHPETRFAGDFETEADYRSSEVRCLIVTGGLDACFDDPEGLIEAVDAGAPPEGAEPGSMVWPIVPFSYDTINREVPFAPSPPDAVNWLGTDDQARDVLARVIYGFDISVRFGLALTVVSSLIGVFAGAAQGYFGGWVAVSYTHLTLPTNREV